MSTLTITAKGQVTLRKDLLRHLGVRPGERVVVEALLGGRIEVRAAPTGDIAAVFGTLEQWSRPALSVADIKRIAADGWTGKR